jgi:cysteine desulfurase
MQRGLHERFRPITAGVARSLSRGAGEGQGGGCDIESRPRYDTGMSRLYLDHNATTPLRPEARAAMLAALDASGNASSVHAEGRAARAFVETARAQVAALVGARPASVVFTSGGTEAANLALAPEVGGAGAPFARLIVSAGEHPCVLDGHRFAAEAVTRALLTADGRIDLAALEALIAGARVMLALQAANNETGVLQPLAEAAALVHAHGGLVVCDAVQMAGKLPFDMGAAGVDMAILSAHKLGGPPGAGALVFGRPALHIRQAALRGGGQERGHRAGTENAPAIAGFGAAAQAAGAQMAGEAARLAVLRDGIEADVRALAPEAAFFGAEAPRLPHVSAFALPGVTAEFLLMALDMEGVAVSSGSACSSGKVKASHVLAAMGVAPDLARCAIRVSAGWPSQDSDRGRFFDALGRVLATLRRRRQGSTA